MVSLNREVQWWPVLYPSSIFFARNRFGVLGYSDFHNLMGFTCKKLPNNILKNVYWTRFIFNWLRHVLRICILPVYFFFAYDYQKYAEFYAGFKSVEILGEKFTQKKLFAKNFCKLVI